jgi:PAS domain S-box-containing protein
MSGIILLVVVACALCSIFLFFHYFSPRAGFAPLLMLISALTVFLQMQTGVYIELNEFIHMFISSTLFVPVILAAVLVVYVSNGAVPARMLIFGILGTCIFAVLMMQIYGVFLDMPNVHTIELDSISSLLNPDLRILVASVIAFAVDMVVIAIFYQGALNLRFHIPEWLAIGLSLLAALWADAIVFNLVAYLGTSRFLVELPAHILGKGLSAVVLFPLVAFYLTRIAPKIEGHIGGSGRPLFDLLFGSPQEIKLALVRTEAALEESEAKRRQEAEYFRQITEHIDEALWLAEPYQNHAFYVNPAYEQIWGRNIASLRADPLSFINALHPEDSDRVLSNLPRQVKGGYKMEYRVVRPDGTIRWVQDRAFPILNEEGQPYRVAGVARDITDEKENEKHRLDLAVERERVKMLRDFISDATHDLKTPLSAINLRIHQLSKTQDADKRKALVEQIKQSSSRMGKMINDLLTLSRLESSSELTLSRVDMNELLEEVCSAAKAIAESKNIKISFDLAKKSPYIFADRDDLERAMANLIENAVFYTPSNGTVTIKTAIKEHEVVTKISDTGIGIPKEARDEIFTRFYRAENARTFDPAGTGLGLAIVKKVVEQHLGHIDVESEVGVGTTFIIALPHHSEPS